MGFEYNAFSAKVANDPAGAAAELRRLAAQNLSPKEIGEQLGGASSSTVLRWLDRLRERVPAAVDFNLGAARYAFAEKVAADPAKAAAELHALAERGLTARQIGEALGGATARTVTRWVAALNAKLPGSVQIELRRGPRVGSKRPTKSARSEKRARSAKKVEDKRGKLL